MQRDDNPGRGIGKTDTAIIARTLREAAYAGGRLGAEGLITLNNDVGVQAATFRNDEL